MKVAQQVKGFSVVVALALAGVTGCSRDAKPPANPTLTSAVMPTSAAPAPQPAGMERTSSSIYLSEEIREQCNIASIGAVSDAPKFNFDKSDIREDDHAILSQVAACLSNGPLAGRSVRLVGRADARGTEEYNMALGARRSDSVLQFLEANGVGSSRVMSTSRGELDATGQDLHGYMTDRRVDIDVQ